jgi:hypothetical protein
MEEDNMTEQLGARTSLVLALAGRRIDAEGAFPPRFPLSQAETVRQRLHKLLATERASVITCSAACGADLLALEEAGKLGIRRRLVLPFSKERFRRTSVVDRPGKWGDLYDSVVAEVELRGDLVVLPMTAGDDTSAYQAANEAIIREANIFGASGERAAVVVWEGGPRLGSDATEAFRKLAAQAGFSERVVLTL